MLAGLLKVSYFQKNLPLSFSVCAYLFPLEFESPFKTGVDEVSLDDTVSVVQLVITINYKFNPLIISALLCT